MRRIFAIGSITLLWLGAPLCYYLELPQKYTAAFAIIAFFMLFSNFFMAWMNKELLRNGSRLLDFWLITAFGFFQVIHLKSLALENDENA